ncbi:hypothetical protein, partial [Escherichia coli]|uniref:hypothetical protein n=2 Tax=Escherichia coli TaxID=562 RepID=UPI0021BFA3C9
MGNIILMAEKAKGAIDEEAEVYEFEGMDDLIQFRKKFPEQMKYGTVAKLAMRQPFVLFKGLTFQKLCLPGAFRPGDHHNK